MADEPIVYLDGAFLPQSQAALPVDDRGAAFGDGAYEVVRYFAGKPFAMQPHLNRLARSLDEIRLDAPDAFDALPALSTQLLERNGLRDATVYWQVTRGAAGGARDRLHPEAVEHHVLLTASPAQGLADEEHARPISCCLQPDIRWGRCDIKALVLLPTVMARNHAQRRGFGDAILHHGDTVTEATAANLFIVSDGELWTHPADTRVLWGVTRRIVIDLAREIGVHVREEPFSIAQMLAAEAVFLTGTTVLLKPVDAIDGAPLATDHPIARQLRRALLARVLAECGAV